MRWLTDEVFTPESNETRTELDEEQRVFEEELAREIEREGEVCRNLREEARRIIRETPDANGQDDE
jgi:hypothetical protein